MDTLFNTAAKLIENSKKNPVRTEEKITKTAEEIPTGETVSIETPTTETTPETTEQPTVTEQTRTQPATTDQPTVEQTQPTTKIETTGVAETE